MDGTTMDAGSTGATVSEAASTGATSVLEPVAGLLRGVWWLGLGTVVVVGEQTGRLVTALVERGREVEPAVIEPLKKAQGGVSAAVGEAGAGLKELRKKIGRGAEKIEAVLDERIAAALERTEAPLREEVGNLASAVDQLTKKVEQLIAKREKSSEGE
jgi:poly(hydroxyalkanoate) granule-associated protein